MNLSGIARHHAAASLCVALLALAPHARADAEASPLAPPDTSSPRATAQSFVENIETAFRPFYRGETREDPFLTPSGLRAVQCLDVSELRPAQAERLAREAVLLLAEMINRVGLPPAEEIPDAEAMAEIPEGRRRAWRIPETALEIVQVADGPSRGEYLFSAETVARIREFYGRSRDLPYRPDAMVGLYERVVFQPGPLFPLTMARNLPDWAKRQIGTQAVWQWLALAVGIAAWLALCVGALAAARNRGGPPRHWRAFAARLVMLPLTLALRNFIDEDVKIIGPAFEVVDITLVLLAHLVSGAAGLSLGAAIGESIIASPHIDPRSVDAHLIRLVARALAWVGAIGLALAGASSVGVPLTALVTSLGVGGLAFALAARPTLENLVAGVTLFVDKPVRVGTFCAFDGVVGQIEEIGIRSTKVRRWGGNRLTIPNAQFAALKLDNYDDTSNLWIRTTIGLRYETTPDQLRFVLAKFRELLAGHPRLTGSPRARLAGFGDYSLDVEILAYADTGNWMEWHAIREDVFLHIMDIVDESGTSFAFPSQTTYLARDRGLDAERSQRAEETVRSWRESNTLPFPDLALEDAERARGKFQFPPAGSVAHQPQPVSNSPPEDI